MGELEGRVMLALRNVRGIARQYRRRHAVLVGERPGLKLYELPRPRPRGWFYFMLIAPGKRTLRFAWNGDRLNRSKDAAVLERSIGAEAHKWVRSIIWRYRPESAPQWGEKVSPNDPSPLKRGGSI
jgi:hypothetical protein